MGYKTDAERATESGAPISTISPISTVRRVFSTWAEPLPLKTLVDESEPFPVNRLGILRDPVEAVIDSTQAPAAIVAQSYLAIAALLAQPHINVMIDGRVHPVSMWLITIALSGERKSAVDKIALAPVTNYEKDLIESYSAELIEWQVKNEELAAKKKKNPRPFLEWQKEKPPYPMLTTSEPTYEGLVKSLHEGLPSIGLFSDEGGRFVGGHAMNNDNLLKSAAGFSELWDGSPVRRTRGKDGETYTIYGRRASMHLMIQPTVAYRLINNELLQGQGFLPRCLVTQPSSTIGTRYYRKTNAAQHPSVVAVNKLFTKILRMGMPTENGAGKHRNVVYVDDAYQDWIGMHDEYEKQATGIYQPIQAMACKGAEHLSRIAATLAFIEDPEVQKIESHYVYKAAAIVDFYLAESLRLRQMAEDEPKLLLAEKSLEWAMKQGGTVSKSDLMRKGPKKVRSKMMAEQILRVLHDHGLARQIDNENTETWEFRKYEEYASDHANRANRANGYPC